MVTSFVETRRIEEGLSPHVRSAFGSFYRSRSPVMDETDWTTLVRMIAHTRTDGIDCGDCFAELDRFVELTKLGKPVEDLLPRVKAHLDRCGDCREEYDALLAALREVE